MAFDFNPELTPEEDAEITKMVQSKKKKDEVKKEESALVAVNIGSAEVVTMNNLLGLTQSHIDDDNKCRQVMEVLTEELNNSIHLMSVKEILEYLKIKLREREFHVDCIFKAYAFVQKSEFSREMFVGSHRKERIIEATDRKRINGLLSMLNSADSSNVQ